MIRPQQDIYTQPIDSTRSSGSKRTLTFLSLNQVAWCLKLDRGLSHRRTDDIIVLHDMVSKLQPQQERSPNTEFTWLESSGNHLHGCPPVIVPNTIAVTGNSRHRRTKPSETWQNSIFHRVLLLSVDVLS